MVGGYRGRSLALSLLLISVLAVFGFWEIRHSFEKNLRTDLVRIVRQAYEGRVEIGSVHLNLLTGNVHFRNVRFRFPLGPSGEYRTLFDFPRVDGHLSLLSLLTRVYDFRDLTFRNPSITAVMGNGADNYRGFFEKWREGVQTPHGGGAVVRSFKIRNGRVSWGFVGESPVVEMRDISGRVTSNPLMNRFQVRFSSPRLGIRKAGGGESSWMRSDFPEVLNRGAFGISGWGCPCARPGFVSRATSLKFRTSPFWTSFFMERSVCRAWNHSWEAREEIIRGF